MDDFNEYVNNAGEYPNDIFRLVNSIAQEYDGKNQNELLMAIYKEAKRGKEAGTLTNAELDGFARMISPLLDEKKKKILEKIVGELKKL